MFFFKILLCCALPVMIGFAFVVFSWLFDKFPRFEKLCEKIEDFLSDGIFAKL